GPVRGVLWVVVSVALDRLGILAPIFRIRSLGSACAIRRAQRPAARTRRVPLDGAVRTEARASAVGLVPAGGRRGGVVRDGGDLRTRAGAPRARPCGRCPRGAARRCVLPAG